MKHLLNKTYVSIDIETLSTRQNAVIVQLGATMFTINDGVLSEFTINIDPKSCRLYGMHISKDTLQWWSDQDESVRKSWQKDKYSLPDALTKFNEWLGECKKYIFIANGIVFDFGILSTAYTLTGIEKPWPYWQEVDLRTMSFLFDVKLSGGNNHNALFDARNQMESFLSLFKEN